MNLQKYAGVAWPVVLALLTGIYAYWVSQQELVSSRPPPPSKFDVPDPIPDPGVSTTHSRLWQDPLSTAFEDWKLQRPLQAAVLDSELPEDLGGSLKSSSTNDDASLFPHDVASALALLRNLPFYSSSHPSPRQRQTYEMKEHFRDLVDKTDQDTLCLPVFVSGGPYAEDKETRMRTRYAIVTALAEHGYYLKSSTRMSYVVVSIYVRTLRGWRVREITVPVKLYRHKDDAQEKHQVLVLWINESELGLRPLLATQRILNALFSEIRNPEKLTVTIIGPASSDVLENICAEVRNFVPADGEDADKKNNRMQHLRHWHVTSYAPLRKVEGYSPIPVPDLPGTATPIRILSPRATVSDAAFRPDNRVFELYRVIGTDQQLADLLYKELEQRGATNDDIVLITEHDTSYGRKIVQCFERAIPHDGQLRIYKILKGVDGSIPGDNAKRSPSPAANHSSANDFWSELNGPSEMPPEGRSQYDYLERLWRRINEERKTQPHFSGRRIGAIGVVGSDVYDKLLVLRALKPHFPDCVFFTTDLDAIYTDAQENRETRNLVVASHFTLALADKIQPHTPPFRESYQTATYLAARLAFASLEKTKGDGPDEGEKIDWAEIMERCKVDSENKTTFLPPVLSVVGRDAIEPLSTSTYLTAREEEISKQVHPLKAGSGGLPHSAIVVGLFVAVVLGGALILQRQWFQDSMLLHRWEGDDVLISPSVRYTILAVAAVAITLGLGLVGWSFWIGHTGDYGAAAMFGGSGTWFRNTLFGMIGICAIGALLYLVDGLVAGLRDAPGAAGARARELFKPTLLLKCLAFGFVAVFACWLCLMDPPWLLVLAGILVFAGAAIGTRYLCRYLSIPEVDDDVKRNIVLSNCPAGFVYWSALLMTAVAALVFIVEQFVVQTDVGWHPWSFGRGWMPRVNDWIAMAYGFGAVGVLLAGLVFVHVWCRELARDAERHVVHGVGGENAWKELDRLSLIGSLTSVSNSLGPVLFTLVIMLVLSFHPFLSSTPMSTGLLFVTSLGMVLFVLSALLLRWHFNGQREATIARVQEQIWAAEDGPQDSSPGGAAHRRPQVPGRAGGIMAADDGTEEEVAVAVAEETAAPTGGGPNPEIERLQSLKRRFDGLSSGVFRPWGQSFLGWTLGGGASLALIDLWVRWWSIGL